MSRRIVVSSILSLVLLSAKAIFSQGCASCYTTAAAGGAKTIHALRNGIIVLLVPPAVVFTGLMLILRRWRTSAEADIHNDS